MRTGVQPDAYQLPSYAQDSKGKLIRRENTLSRHYTLDNGDGAS